MRLLRNFADLGNGPGEVEKGPRLTKPIDRVQKESFCSTSANLRMSHLILAFTLCKAIDQKGTGVSVYATVCGRRQRG